jgi:hypothetical protein
MMVATSSLWLLLCCRCFFVNVVVLLLWPGWGRLVREGKGNVRQKNSKKKVENTYLNSK